MFHCFCMRYSRLTCLMIKHSDIHSKNPSILILAGWKLSCIWSEHFLQFTIFSRHRHEKCHNCLGRTRTGKGRKEGNVLFNDALNTFYLRLYGIRHMVKDHFDSEKGNLLPPHRLLFPINSKGSFICTIPQTG